MRHDIIPGLQYTDAPAAIAFLCNAFGFERHAVYTDDKDPAIVLHAQLVWQDRMVMLGTAREATPARPMKTASAAGGVTMGLYLTVEDVDSHAARAQAAGATILQPPRDMEYGGRGYSALDPEGNMWSFGSFDPWSG